MFEKGLHRPPPGPYFRYNVTQISTHSFSVLHATMSFKAVKWLRASLTVHNHNKLQNPCCGSRDLRTSCLAPSKCVYQSARSYAALQHPAPIHAYAIPICPRGHWQVFVTNTSTISTLSYPDVLALMIRSSPQK